MKPKAEKKPPLEEGLLRAMQAIDKQIAREMQRTPDQRELKGVVKWEPLEKRVELVTGLLLEAVSSNDCELDSLMVLSQASSKALRMFVEEIGTEDLGSIRSSYAEKAFESIQRDADLGVEAVKGRERIN